MQFATRATARGTTSLRDWGWLQDANSEAKGDSGEGWVF